MKKVIAMLEKVANSLESKGLVKEAEMLDIAANSVEAGFLGNMMFPVLLSALSLFASQNPGGNMSPEQLKEWLTKNKTQIESDAKKQTSLNQLEETKKYDTASPVHVEKTRQTGGGRYSLTA
jgi:hypothetical protein